jgi:hypothetical protein
MKRSITFMAVMLFILVSGLAVGLGSQTTVKTQEDRDKYYPNQTVQKKLGQSGDLPYRDDADYSGHNEVFQMEGELPASTYVETK